MVLSIIALIVFGIGLVSWIIDTAKNPTLIKIVVCAVFSVVYAGTIIWALKEFIN